MTPRRLLPLLVVLVVAACTGGGESVDVDGTTATTDGTGTTATPTGPATAAPSDTGTGTGAATADSLVAAMSAEPDQLDPHLTTASPSFTVNEQIYDVLVQTTPDLTFEPGLATDWQTSDDQLTWTFTLREDVTFHDDSAFTAEDVVATYERIRDPDVGAANAYRLDGVESVDAVDDMTVEITLAQPAPNLLANLSNHGLAIVPSEAIEAGTLEDQPVGTGPFTFESYTEGSSITLAANPDYWAGAPSIGGVEFQFISEGTVALTALRTGEIAWTNNVPPQNVSEVLEDESIQAESVPSTDYWYYAFNLEREPFDDPVVREAFARAFDRQSVTEAAKFGAASVNQTAIPESSAWYHDYAPYHHDLDQAGSLLEQAGVDPSSLSFEMLASSEFPETVQASQVLAAQWGELGVQMDIVSPEFATWLDRNANNDFDVKIGGWLGNIDPNDYYYSQHHCDGANNTQGYCNQEVSDLLDQGRTETDMEARKEIYDQVAEMIVDDNSYTYLYNPDNVEAWAPGVSGYEVRPDGKTVFADVSLG